MGAKSQRLCTVRVVAEEDLKQAVAESSPFELCKHFSSVDIVFHLPETENFGEVRRRVAERLHLLPASDLRFWRWGPRQDGSYRPALPVLGDTSLSSLIRRGSDPPVVDLYVEQAKEAGSLPLYDPASDLLLFVKAYRGASNGGAPQLEYAGSVVVSADTPLALLRPRLQQVAGFPEGEGVEVMEEAAPCLQRLLPGYTARKAHLQTGDILVLSPHGAKPSAEEFFAAAAARLPPPSPAAAQQAGAQHNDDPLAAAAQAAATRVSQLLQQAAQEAEAALQAAAARAQKQQADLRAREQAHSSSVASLQARLQQEAQGAAHALEEERKQAAARLAQREAELQKAAEEAAEAAAAIAATLQQRLAEREAEAEAQLAAAREEVAALRQRVNAQDSELAEAQDQTLRAQLGLQFAQEEAEQVQRQLDKGHAEVGQLKEGLAAREADVARLQQAEAAAIAAVAAREAAHSGQVRELEAQLAAAVEQSAMLQQEVAAREQMFEGRLRQAEQSGSGRGGGGEEVEALRARLAEQERRYQARLKGLESGQELITKRLLVLEGDEEACRSLSAGGLRSLLRSLEASSSRVRHLITGPQAVDPQTYLGSSSGS